MSKPDPTFERGRAKVCGEFSPNWPEAVKHLAPEEATQATPLPRKHGRLMLQQPEYRILFYWLEGDRVLIFTGAALAVGSEVYLDLANHNATSPIRGTVLAKVYAPGARAFLSYYGELFGEAGRCEQLREQINLVMGITDSPNVHAYMVAVTV